MSMFRPATYSLQCPLDFATLDKAAALGLATSRALTDLRQYINSDLGFSDLKMCFFNSVLGRPQSHYWPNEILSAKIMSTAQVTLPVKSTALCAM